MKVSIRQALENVASEKYDKKNIFLYFIVLLLANVISLFLPEELSNSEVLKTMSIPEILAIITEPHVIAIIISSIFLAIVCNGCLIVSTHNAINGKEGVFPNIFKDMLNLILKSILYIIGSTIIMVAITLFSITLSQQLLPIHIGFIALIIPIIILLVHSWLCLNFRFYMTLKFKDWFSFKKSWMMIMQNIRRFGSYIGKSIVLFIFALGLILGITFILGIILGVISYVQAGNIDIISTAIAIIITACQVVISCFTSVYIVDLTAQLLGPIAKAEATQPEEI